jgi:hypothetical protein
VEDKVILEYLLEEEVDLVVVVKVVVDLVPHLLEQLHLLQKMGHPDITPVVEVEVLETPELWIKDTSQTVPYPSTRTHKASYNIKVTQET